MIIFVIIITSISSILTCLLSLFLINLFIKSKKNQRLIPGNNQENIDKILHKIRTDLNNIFLQVPINIENNLIKILNVKGYIDENKLINFLSANNINFDNPNFIVSIIKFNFSNDFYNLFTKEEYFKIISSIFHFIKKLFPDNTILVLSVSECELCLIFNIPNLMTDKYIIKTLKSIFNIYSSEKNYIEIFSGIGRIYTGIKGLQQSYKEAYIAINSISLFQKEYFKIYHPVMLNERNYTFTVNDENKIINYLLSGYEHRTKKLIKNIINKNRIINNADTKKLYMKMYNTCIKAINRKKLSEKSIMKEKYIDLILKYSKMENSKILNYIFILVENICYLRSRMLDRKINIENIIEYIDQNFYKDISLEKIAYDYNISSPHLSRLLRMSLGMSFQQYLNNKRIKRAKIILESSPKNLDEISTECGFNSRFTFIRMFKKLEGITPTQYRNIEHEKVF